MKEIIPAIMPKNFDDLKLHLERVRGLVSTVQIDVMDGKFVKAKSWPLVKEGDRDFLNIVNQEEGFPYWEDINIEADLMVSDPRTHADQWVAAGAIRIILHYTSAPQDQIAAILSELKEKGVETGVAFTIKTSDEEMLQFIENHRAHIDFVQCMGIETIGLQGEPFEQSVVHRISKLKDRFTNLTISVDGGVNYDTAQDLLDVGVDRLVSGSAIFQSESVENAILDFKDLFEENRANFQTIFNN